MSVECLFDTSILVYAVSSARGISYWDGAIVAAAEVLEAPVLYSEDLSHGQRYGTVRVVNAFLEA